MAYIFDGKQFSIEIEEKLKVNAQELRGKGIVPKLVSLQLGSNPASSLFLSLKKKAAQRIGLEMEVELLGEDVSFSETAALIERLNRDSSVNGVMVQLPLPEKFSQEEKETIIGKIAPNKDVDGMREDSPYIAPVVRAVTEIASMGEEYLSNLESPFLIVIVGAEGFVGKQLLKAFGKVKSSSYRTEGVDVGSIDLKDKIAQADFLISATGDGGFITGRMVKKGAVVVDVGSPQGDVKTEEVAEAASFISPVPGGVGPVTISYLMENLILSAAKVQQGD